MADDDDFDSVFDYSKNDALKRSVSTLLNLEDEWKSEEKKESKKKHKKKKRAKEKDVDDIIYSSLGIPVPAKKKKKTRKRKRQEDVDAPLSPSKKPKASEDIISDDVEILGDSIPEQLSTLVHPHFLILANGRKIRHQFSIRNPWE